MQARANFRSDMQALLAQGYAVLMPNVRGSTGYGRAYMDADDVEKRLDSVHDLAAGREWLVRQPGIDPARIAVMGQSYGGYMVLAAVTEYPDLWRCAIDFYGIADFGTLLAATGPWRRGHRAAEYGDPSRHRALFDRISPIRHFHRVRVPILVLHGTRDPRVGFGESEQVVSALQERRRPVRFEVFEYAGHGFVRPDDKVRVYGAIAAFLGAEL
jgi:dipeptidyl aminopeptidase/acylaminoacyl peptidase